jgi:hypothetical protein
VTRCSVAYLGGFLLLMAYSCLCSSAVQRLALQRAPVKGRKRISKSPALAGRNRLCGLRRPLQGRGSPLFEADLYANAAPDLDSLPKCYSSFGPKGRPPGQFGAVVKRRRQSARLGERATSAATCEAGCGPRPLSLTSGLQGTGRWERPAEHCLGRARHHCRSRRQRSCPASPPIRLRLLKLDRGRHALGSERTNVIRYPPGTPPSRSRHRSSTSRRNRRTRRTALTRSQSRGSTPACHRRSRHGCGLRSIVDRPRPAKSDHCRSCGRTGFRPIRSHAGTQGRRPGAADALRAGQQALSLLRVFGLTCR